MSADPKAAERKRLAVIGSLGLAALLVLLAIRPSKRSRDDARDAAPPATVASAAAPQTPASVATGPLTAAEWARIDAILPDRGLAAAPDGSEAAATAWDAFRAMPGPSSVAAAPTDAAPASPERFRLEGVSVGHAGAKRHAILNDRVVRVGDDVDGLRVVAIERGRVTLEGGGGRRTEISIRSENGE